ncbi:MAG TPA: M36 family metallopeptidase [Solirubrobacterales bacterium]|nr:M36 family metallopeptidase [Solirubrobacterales bacterium]
MSGARSVGRSAGLRALVATILALATMGIAPPSQASAAYVGKTDGLLTGPSANPPEQIVLDHVRAHEETFGLDERDIGNLQLVARSVSPDGIVHLRFNQVLAGILSFESGIDGHVTADGRLINVSGAPVPGARLADTDPALSAQAGLREAREAVDGESSERAILRWSATADGPRLAWSVIAESGEADTYEVLIDAESGALLHRQSLTTHLGEARYFGADPLRTPDPIEITMPPQWYDDSAGGTRLWGQYSRTYIDPFDEDPAPGEEQGGELIQVPASAGTPAAPDWLYAQSTNFPGATPCPPSGCTWNSANSESSAVNQFQAATNAHVLASRFHDYLEGAPIGFDEASGNFQRTNTSGSGVGNDYVRLEVNDGEGRNNANFSTPPDGIAPRMQMFLYTRRDVNGSDIADIVYHEYAHGLSNRLVVNASGSSALTGFQSRMMGEGWSDFYAVDLLVHEGHFADTPAPGEVRKGFYIYSPGGTRNKPIDCPVDSTGKTTACNEGTDVPVLGGYTYGDIVDMYTRRVGPGVGYYNESPHEGGEIWGQTLWDIRTALGREAALAVITGGMRLSVDAPSMLDMRDAILQQAVAMRSAPGAADDHTEELWEVFAKRGMGAGAGSRSGDTTFPQEDFGLLAAAAAPTFADPYPEGDNDGTIEPGEGFEVSQKLRSVTPSDVSEIKGTLTAGGGATVVDGTAVWPLLGGDRQEANSDPLSARLPANCFNAAPLTVSLTSTGGPAKVRHTIDLRPGSSEAVPLADATSEGPGVTTASIEVEGSGTVTDLGLRLDELRHRRPGDLKIELIHDGASAVVLDRAWEGQDVFDLILHSSGSSWVGVYRRGPMTGLFQPFRDEADAKFALNAFNGLPIAGTWTLRITDDEEGEAGVLHRWGIDSPQQACPGRLEIPQPQTGGAIGVEQRAATLNGAVTPNGRETGLRFAFGTTAAYGETSPVTSVGAGDGPVGASLDLTGLQPGTTYHYRVEAIREGGQVATVGADRTVTTLGPTGTDPPGGGGPPVLGPPTIDLAPAINGAAVTLTRAEGRTTRRRASFSFSLSEPATVTAVLTRAAAGIRAGRRCVAPPWRRPRGAKPCERLLPATKGTVALSTGRGTLPLAAAGLARGRYVATLTAVDAGGNPSAPVVVRFTVR